LPQTTQKSNSKRKHPPTADLNEEIGHRTVGSGKVEGRLVKKTQISANKFDQINENSQYYSKFEQNQYENGLNDTNDIFQHDFATLNSTNIQQNDFADHPLQQNGYK